MSFAITVVHAGVTTSREVSPADTVRMLRERMGLTTERFARGRQALGLDKSFDELGVVVGATLTCYAAPRLTDEAQAARRIRLGASRTSSRYPHLCKFVATDGAKTRQELVPIADGVEACNKKLDDMQLSMAQLLLVPPVLPGTLDLMRRIQDEWKVAEMGAALDAHSIPRRGC